MNKQELLPEEIAKRIPELDEVRDQLASEMTAVVKWFYPDFSWTWYGVAHVEGDVYFGFVDGDEGELGDFSLAELMATRGKWGCPIERDRFFEPQPLEPIMMRVQERWAEQ